MSNFKFNINLIGGKNIKEKRLQTLILQEEVKKLPQMGPDQLHIDTLYMHDMGDTIECKIMLRSTVKAPINLSDVKFIMKDENKNKITDFAINLNFLGSIPQYSATPFSIDVKKDKLNLEGIDIKKCKLSFATNVGAHMSTNLELGYTQENIDVLHLRAIERHIDSLPPMKNDTWEVEQFKVFKEENEEALSVIFLVKNAYERAFTIENPDFRLKDSMGITMAQKTIEKLPQDVKGGTIGAFKVTFKGEDLVLKDFNELLYGTLEITNGVEGEE